VCVEPLELDPSALRRMRDQLLLFYTGEARSASRILADQNTRSQAGDGEMLENLHRTKEIGRESCALLRSGRLEEYAELMHEHWQHKRRRSPGMSDGRIDMLYELARANGTIGGKLVGAGGGGFLLVYTQSPEQTRQAMAEENAQELAFDFEFCGAYASEST
jgi:D-glycero-alpha-D-manno-heptose-7-phosphate kinase